VAKTPSRKKPSSTTRPALTLAHQAAHESLLPLILSFPPRPAAVIEAAPAIKAPEAPAASRATETATASRATETTAISPEERHRLIALHAFRRAQHRGLGSTDPFHDWLIAEREINALLTPGVASLGV
jgi:hypothetical protein